MTTLAVAAVAAAIGGAVVAQWRRADDLIISLLRADAINREAEVDA